MGEAQREKGRLYQVRDRSWRAERKLAARMHDGLLLGLQLPARVHWFGLPPAQFVATQTHVNQPEQQEQ